MRSSSILAAAAAVLAIASSASADVITDWNGTGIEILRDRAVGPNKSTRVLAIAQLAAYDAVVAITKSHEPYLPGLEADLPASPEAAAAQAAHDVLLALYPDAEEELADALTDSLEAIDDGDAEDNGVTLGKAAAEAILEARAADHSSDTVTYEGSNDPGKWRPTPAAYAAAADPQWGTVTPFALESANQFRPSAPPALNSVEYTLAFTEVKLWGKATGSARDAEQTKIAKFWEQATHVPFYAIARSLAKREGLTVEESARLFALLSLALADSRIATSDAKYTYDFWRPVTAITTVPVAGEGGAGGEASEGIDDDGNPETIADPAWLPYLNTPNHPEYVSGHSATGAAAAGVLAYWFGDETSFAVGSDSAPGFTRSFESFSDAADQNAISRLYGGIHYSFSNEAGLALGAEVAGYVVDHYLLERSNGEGGAGGDGAGGAAPEPSGGGEGGEPPTTGTGGTSGGTGVAGAPDSGGEGGVPDKSATGGAGGKPPKANVDKHDGDDSGCSVSSTGHDANAAGWLAVVAGLGLAISRRRR
jgi:MYXO-CTERM domain-containing protein